MDFETQIAMANEKLDNEIYIDYLIDNINECQNAINEYSDAIEEEVQGIWECLFLNKK